MSPIKKAFLWILVLGCVFLFANMKEQEMPVALEIKVEMPNLIDEVEQQLELCPKIPGISSEKSHLWRKKILDIWKEVIKKGSFELTGKDKEMRPFFVAIQGAVEHCLAHQLQKEIISLKAFILTPLPAGSLCSTGEISQELIDPSIELDPASLFNIKARTNIVRDFLFKGGELYIIYPKKGFRQRSLEQQKIYTHELVVHSNCLFDNPLNCEQIPHELVGALYLFQTQDGQVFVFAIKMMQEKNSKEKDTFCLWFGPLDHPDIRNRLSKVNSFLEATKCRALKDSIEEFSNSWSKK